MLLRVTKLAEGPGPGEVVVKVTTSTGHTEQVVIDNSVLAGDMIEVGRPIRRLPEKALIELPRESTSGRWRLWVLNDEIVDA